MTKKLNSALNTLLFAVLFSTFSIIIFAQKTNL
ncbi:hypothetical protein BH20ACI4_BH20ACI4_04710 [soil metagenome]